MYRVCSIATLDCRMVSLYIYIYVYIYMYIYIYHYLRIGFYEPLSFWGVAVLGIFSIASKNGGID